MLYRSSNKSSSSALRKAENLSEAILSFVFCVILDVIRT